MLKLRSWVIAIQLTALGNTHSCCFLHHGWDFVTDKGSVPGSHTLKGKAHTNMDEVQVKEHCELLSVLLYLPYYA